MSNDLSMIKTVDDAHKSSAISVKPYYDPDVSNMGLETYGMTLFDGVFHEEQLAMVEKNGVRRYLTGLNEFAPEVKLIKDKSEREAKIKQIREIVTELERELATNILDPDDKDFWNKVQLLRPDNDDFWKKISLRCGNQPVPLDPKKEPHDRIKIHAIEAGGFAMIAPSYQAARKMAVAPKFYLDKSIDTIATKTSLTKLRNRALAALQELYDTDPKKLFYIAKCVDTASIQYRNKTPNDVIYDAMDKFITGNGVEKNLKRAAQTFLDTSKLEMEELILRAIVKDGTYYKFLVLKSDGFIYEQDTNAMMGRNIADCIEYLKNPVNDEVLAILQEKVKDTWNQ